MKRRRGFLARLQGFARVIARPREKKVPALARLLAKMPPLLICVSLFELALLLTNRVDPRLKALASVQASSLVGCPF